MRARLVFTSGSKAGTDFEFTGFEATVGRSPDCTIQFSPTEVVVSGHHATLYELGGRFYVRDENSRNGTFVDGRPVKECEIRAGQTVMFGPNGPSAQLDLMADDAAPTSPMPAGWGAGATAYVAPGPAHTPAAGPPKSGAGGGGGAGSGLTNLYFMAREQAAAASASGRPSGTAVMKAFVKMASERSARRTRILVGLVALAGMAAVAVVVVLGMRERGQLEGRLVTLNTQLESERGSRAGLEAQLQSLQSQAGVWQSQSEALKQQLSASQQELRQQMDASQAELRRQRQEIADQTAAVERDLRFGPTVNERYAGGVCLIQLVYGYRNANGQWLRLRGTPKAGIEVADPSDTRAPMLTQGGFGTGFLIDGAGWILTNRHVAAPFADDKGYEVGGQQFAPAWVSMKAFFPPGDKVYDLQVSAISREHDLGLLQTAAPPRGVPALPIATTSQLRPGDELMLLGYPTGTTNIFWRADSAQLDAITQAQRTAFERAVTDGRFEAAVQLISQAQEGKVTLTDEQKGDLTLALTVISSATSAAALDEAARLRLVQPHSSAGAITDTTRTDVFHSAQMVGGASGGPLMGHDLRVLSVNYAFSLQEDRGATFQKNRSVPYAFIWSFLPPDLKTRLRGR